MAITLNTAFTKAETSGAAASLTISTTVAAGTDTVLILPFLAYDSVNASRTYSAARNGQNFVIAALNGPSGTTPDNDQVFIAYLVSPTVGTFNTVITPSGGTSYMVGGAGSFDGIDQSTVVRTAATAQGSVAQSQTYSLAATSVSGDLCIGAFAVYVGTTYALSTSDTSAFEEENGALWDSISVGYEIASGSSTSIDVTTSNYGGQTGSYWAINLPFIPSSGGPAGQPTMRRPGILENLREIGRKGTSVYREQFRRRNSGLLVPAWV